MGSTNSKSDSPSPQENVFVSYYCDHLVNQKINIKNHGKGIEKETFQNVYDFRKNSIKKKSNSHTINSKNKI